MIMSAMADLEQSAVVRYERAIQSLHTKILFVRTGTDMGASNEVGSFLRKKSVIVQPESSFIGRGD
jgi:hypothetical protein